MNEPYLIYNPPEEETTRYTCQLLMSREATVSGITFSTAATDVTSLVLMTSLLVSFEVGQ
jgi:hypothetical protein